MYFKIKAFIKLEFTPHDSKKELMAQFCIAYCGILSQHKICATNTTGKFVSEATGLEITKFLSGAQGGDQQIASLISYNEIDLVLFFRDPVTQRDSESATNLLRLCDVQKIPLSTNTSSAKIMLEALKNGIYFND